MSNNAVKALAEQLAILSVKFSVPPSVPEDIITAHENAPWLSLSLATLYLSFARACLQLLVPVEAVGIAVAKCMDDEFFECVKASRFEVKISDVIVFLDERAAICQRWRMSPKELFDTFSNSDCVLELVYADRSNQYRQDLLRGVIRQREGQTNALGPLIFVYKRFNQHMYGIKCDMATISLDEPFKHMLAFDLMFMDALEALTAAIGESAAVLPKSL